MIVKVAPSLDKYTEHPSPVVGPAHTSKPMIEGEYNAALAKDDHLDPTRWYSAPQARLIPTTFIVKARKPLV
jgi:hypothetical protein